MPDLEERVAALEAIVAQLTQPEPDFMRAVREDPIDGNVLTVRLTHEPTGVTVLARDRAEGIYKLRKAITGHWRRLSDLQERERRRLRKEAREASAPAP
jgi:hypothetical protein